MTVTTRNWLFLIALLGLAALVAACPSQGPVLDEAPPIVGRVVFPGDPVRSPYTTQATLSEVANAATVILIDTTANLTRGSTITDANGLFQFKFSNGFKPSASASYYLEAVRGLGNNAPGKDAARVRTLMRYVNGWQSITTATVGTNHNINLGTTAIAAIANLKGSSRVNVDDLIGSLSTNPETFIPVPGITASEFTTVKGIASTLLLADLDPLSGIAYDAGPPEVFSMRNVSANLTTDKATASIGEAIVMRGITFDPALPLSTSNIVLFNNVATGSVTGIAADRQSITVAVPNDAVSGPITVYTGGKIYGLPSFTVWSTVNVDLF